MSVYRYGDKVRFAAGSRGRRFLGPGWSGPEADHCWSDGPRAAVSLPVVDRAPEGAVLRIRCRGFCPPGLNAQRVAISVNGRHIRTIGANGMAWHEVLLPPGSVGESGIYVEFEFPDAVSPEQVGASSDSRSLGITLDALVLFENAMPATAGSRLIGAGADPVGDVFVAGSGSFHRAIRRGGLDVYRLASEKGIYQKLAAAGLIPEHVFRAVDDPAYEAIASSVTGRSVYPPKYPWLMFKDAARAWIDINRLLHDESDGTLGLCDGHYGNFVQCDNARPKWCDIGSISANAGALEFGFAEFVRCYMLPLALASIPLREGFNIRQMMVQNTGGMPIADAIAEHGHALAEIGLQERHAPGGRREALDRLVAILDGLDIKARKGYWSGYRDAEALERAWKGDLLRPGNDNRFEQVVSLAKACDVERFIDIGCNDGIFSLLCSREGMQAFGVDLDEDSIDKLYAFAKAHPATDIAISYGGFMDVEGRHPLVLLLALTHHLALTQKLSFPQIARKLASVSSKHVITEFMPDGLGGTPVNPNPVPNPLPPGYSLEAFVSALEAEFGDVRVIHYDRRADPAHMSRRILIHCQSPRQ